MPEQKDVGEQIRRERKLAKDKERPKAPIRLPHKKIVAFKLPKRGLPEKEEAYSKRSVQLVNMKLFRNLNQPEKRVVQGTLGLD